MISNSFILENFEKSVGIELSAGLSGVLELSFVCEEGDLSIKLSRSSSMSWGRPIARRKAEEQTALRNVLCVKILSNYSYPVKSTEYFENLS